uniref:G-protein coupled receptors family 1 profile domain-containing protein n=1 Tax=Poecilia formosa TaxID=48698 RepID=A0A096MHZ8_POEFO
MVTAYFISSILLTLPLSIIILHHGLQQWRLKSFTSTSTTNHSDYFTYHLAIVELIGVLGHFIGLFGIFCPQYQTFLTGFYMFSFAWFGELYFHVLTCVERYLAVVHPVTYLSLRSDRAIRTLTVCCIWLICFVELGLMMREFFNFLNLCVLTLAMVCVFFCSVSVLCALTRPGPGEQRKTMKRIGRSKLRAFYTILSILGVLVVRCAWCLSWAVLYISQVRSNCFLMTYDLWFNLPCILVLPLLFLHRTGKLNYVKCPSIFAN